LTNEQRFENAKDNIVNNNLKHHDKSPNDLKHRLSEDLNNVKITYIGHVQKLTT
jgi:hypothetical protein